MGFHLAPGHITFAALSGLVNERQQQITELQDDQIEAPLRKLDRKRILLMENHRPMSDWTRV